MRCLLFVIVSIATAALSAEKPNIVHIIADDMGYSDLGCYGGEIETPNLDSLADRGVRFTNYYVNNMCWPTRASLMTGLYPKTALPVKGSAKGGLHPQAKTLPQVLRSNGYTTLMSGKWHLSDVKEMNGPHVPHHRGFDQFYGTVDGASDFFAPDGLQLNGKLMTSEWDGNPDFYYTDAITDHALDFIKDRTKKGAPFYLYLSYNAAHWPLHAKPDDIAHYKGRFAMGWDEMREKRHARMKEMGLVNPEWKLSPRNKDARAWEDAKNKDWHERRMEVYAAQITSMDQNIGRVILHLRETGQLDNTIILYHHDNGACHVEYGTKRTGTWTKDRTTDGKNTPIKAGNIPGLMPGAQSTFQSYGYGWANASNTPFRLFKQYDHEGGTRSPLIVSWPAGIDKKRNGSLVKRVSHAIDMMPTLLEFAGIEMIEQKPIAAEGHSFFHRISGAKETAETRRPVFWAHNKGRAVRDGKWKLVANGKGDWELYDLEKDGTELENLATIMPEKVQELKGKFRDWEKRVNGH